MRRSFQFAILLLLLGSYAVAGDVVDRIVVLVNQEPVLLSDWEEAVDYKALVEGRQLAQITPEEQRTVLSKLIDEKLVEQQIRARNLRHSSDQEIDKQVAQLRQQISSGGHDWSSQLQKYGLLQQQVRRQLAAQLDMLHFMDSQILPGVRIEGRSVVEYYRDNFSSKLRSAGQPVPPLDTVSGKIREILTQQKLDELSQQWLHDTRAQSDIRFLGAPVETGMASPEEAR